jgi:hypothetical protein
MLAGCGKPEPTPPVSASLRTETVEALEANPERLKELRRQCRTDRAKLSDELCNRVAEATNRRFMGNGNTPYTPPSQTPNL